MGQTASTVYSPVTDAPFSQPSVTRPVIVAVPAASSCVTLSSAAHGEAWRAARLLGAADARAEASATYTDAADAHYERRAVDLIVAQIGETMFAQARAEGREMTFEQAAAYALETEPSA